MDADLVERIAFWARLSGSAGVRLTDARRGRRRSAACSQPAHVEVNAWAVARGSERLRRVPLRAAAICGLLAPVTFVVGLVLGDLAQPDAFSPANDNISDIGAQTADQAWLYNQVAANLNGLLIVAFALGLWRASDRLARAARRPRAGDPGVTRFLEGFLRLDCAAWTTAVRTRPGRPTHTGSNPVSPRRSSFLSRRCSRSHSGGSRSGATCGFRRSSPCPSWWPSVLFSVIGDGAAVRAASITWFLWLGLLAWRLLSLAHGRIVGPAGEAVD